MNRTSIFCRFTQSRMAENPSKIGAQAGSFPFFASLAKPIVGVWDAPMPPTILAMIALPLRARSLSQAARFQSTIKAREHFARIGLEDGMALFGGNGQRVDIALGVIEI